MIEFRMAVASIDPPNDVELLKAMLLAHQAELVERDAQIAESEKKLDYAEERYRAMVMRLFGRKSEHYSPEEDKQNRLFDEAEEHAAEDAPPAILKVHVPAHDRVKRGRKPKVAAAERIEIVHDLTDEEKRCPCCGEMRKAFGEERRSEYELVPAHVVEHLHIIIKYGPCSCEGFDSCGAPTIAAAKGPAKLIPGSDFTNKTTAFFMTAKYADAIPFYRMEKMLARDGLIVSRATLCNQAVAVGKAIGDLIVAMDRDIRSSPVVLMDETTVQVLKDERGSPGRKSYMWLSRGYRDRKPIHLFRYHATRSGEFASTLLEGYQGYLQTDGYSGYNRIGESPGIAHVGCFAHIRRKFHEAWETAGKTGIASEALEIIRRLYAAESECRTHLDAGAIDSAAFITMRREQIEPIVACFRDWPDRGSRFVAPQSALGKAIAYAVGQIDRASRFIEHELLTPDTNAAENAIRPFVIGRKNRLFSGSPLGAHASAGIYSLIETVKANGHEPFRYLAHVFDKLPRCMTSEEREGLLPYRLSPVDYAEK
jgi:transposase